MRTRALVEKNLSAWVANLQQLYPHLNMDRLPFYPFQIGSSSIWTAVLLDLVEFLDIPVSSISDADHIGHYIFENPDRLNVESYIMVKDIRITLTLSNVIIKLGVDFEYFIHSVTFSKPVGNSNVDFTIFGTDVCEIKRLYRLFQDF